MWNRGKDMPRNDSDSSDIMELYTLKTEQTSPETKRHKGAIFSATHTSEDNDMGWHDTGVGRTSGYASEADCNLNHFDILSAKAKIETSIQQMWNQTDDITSGKVPNLSRNYEPGSPNNSISDDSRTVNFCMTEEVVRYHGASVLVRDCPADGTSGHGVTEVESDEVDDILGVVELDF